MQADEIKATIENAIDNCEAQVQIDGSHVNLIVVSDAFEGLSAVKKQQLVYATLQPAISSGAIHAVNMKTFTASEWSDASSQ